MPRRVIRPTSNCVRAGEWEDRMLVETVLSMLTFVAESGKRDCSRPLASEPDVK